MLSCLLGDSGDIFFPKLTSSLDLTKFSDLALEYLSYNGLSAELCDTEEIAREKAQAWKKGSPWPCLFAPSDTTGEKPYEEFYVQGEEVNLESYAGVGVVKLSSNCSEVELNGFFQKLSLLRSSSEWKKNDLVDLFRELLPYFNHVDGRSRMKKCRHALLISVLN